MKTNNNLEKLKRKQTEIKVLCAMLAMISSCLLIASVDNFGHSPTSLNVIFSIAGLISLFMSGVIYLGNNHD
jgi:hypothetical protein